MKISAVVRAIVPGIGQIHGGRKGRGLLLFLLFALCLNAYLVYPLLDDNNGFRNLCLALAILFWLISFIDALAISRPPPPGGTPTP